MSSTLKTITKNKTTHSFHFLAEKHGKLSEIITEAMSLELLFEQKDLEAILHFGASYLNLQRMFADAEVKPGDYLRIHHPPKRYPTQDIDWKSRIVFENSDFLIINKPAGIPAHATLDNYFENTIYSLEQYYKHPLFITQRLDQPTQGLMTIAKTKIFQSYFNKLLREKQLTKKYRALIPNAPEKEVPHFAEMKANFLAEPYTKALYQQSEELIGLHTHYMHDTKYPPRQLLHYQPVPEPHDRHDPNKKPWLQCQLEITAVTTPVDSSHLFMNWKSKAKADETRLVEVLLLTGRSHQIRTQLAYCGFPIYGDITYGSPIDCGNQIALQSYYLEFDQYKFVLD